MGPFEVSFIPNAIKGKTHGNIKRITSNEKNMSNVRLNNLFAVLSKGKSLILKTGILSKKRNL